MRRLLCVAAVVSTAYAQPSAERPQAPSKGLRFDVASVKPSPDSQRLSRSPAPGRFRVTGFPLDLLIAQAYEIGQTRIIVPDWVRGARFDIEATMPPSTTSAQRLEMLRGLLEDRFSIKVTREVRSIPVLALTRVRDDGRLGPQLKQVKQDCAVKAPDGSSVCRWSEVPGRRVARGLTWDEIPLASQVERYVGAPVIDRTKLSGQFDLTLEWQEGLTEGPEQIQRPGSLEGALREQLGLKLEKTRADMEVLVVEQISRPSPN
jgi:uncharacterized protein (TIGR03435 family)